MLNIINIKYAQREAILINVYIFYFKDYNTKGYQALG